MRFVRALPLAFIAGCVVLSPASLAQTPASSRPAVDARALLPSASAPDLAVAPAASGAGLTRNERKDATLKARQEGALKPAGEGAELRGESGTMAARPAKARDATTDERQAAVAGTAPPNAGTESASAPSVQKKQKKQTKKKTVTRASTAKAEALRQSGSSR
jgi:hypothetical protein